MKSLTPAYVLHRRPFRDTSLLVELFTLAQGRLPLVARGANTLKSRRRALVQPFIPLMVAWTGRGRVKTLTRVEAVQKAWSLRGEALYSAFYLNELLMRLLPQEDPHPALFQKYGDALRALAELTEGRGDVGTVGWVLRRFELDLLEALGYGLDLTRDARGHPLEKGRWYRYQHQEGFFPVAPQTVQAVPGALLLTLGHKEPPTSADQRQARDLMRQILGCHLEGRPLKSRELFRTMRLDPSSARNST